MPTKQAREKPFHQKTKTKQRKNILTATVQQQHFTEDERATAYVHDVQCTFVRLYSRAEQSRVWYVHINSICVLMSKQFNALFMNIVLTLAKLLALVRSRICQSACICTDTHFISLVFGVAHKTIFQTIEAFFFLHLLPITCAVSIS